jgi:hypothetical protein
VQSAFSRASRPSPRQEIYRILWSPKSYCFVHTSRPFVPLPAQINPVHSLPSYSFKILFDVILRYIKRLFSGFPKQILYALLFCAMRATRLPNLIFFEERWEMHSEFWSDNVKWTYHLEDKSLHGRKTLKWILREKDARVWYELMSRMDRERRLDKRLEIS